jgi:hypothetical protein
MLSHVLIFFPKAYMYIAAYIHCFYLGYVHKWNA